MLGLAILVVAVVAAAIAAFGLSARQRSSDANLAAQRLDTIAHDLRQPVQAIELYASALARRLETTEGRAIVDRITAALADVRAQLAQISDAATAQPRPRASIDIAQARVLILGDDGPVCREVAERFRPRVARLETATAHVTALSIAREPFDVIVEHTGHGDPRLGVALAAARRHGARPLILMATEDEEICSALQSERVAFLAGQPSADACVEAVEHVLRGDST